MSSEVENKRNLDQTRRKIDLLFLQNEENERFLQSIIDSISLQLVVLDASHRIVLANTSFLQEYGINEKGCLGHQFADFIYDTITPASCDVNDAILNKEGQAVWRSHREDGDKWFEMADSFLHDRNGRVEFTIRLIRDITDQRLLVDEQMNRGKLQGVIEMAGAVAHELNSPLFAALGTAQLLREEFADSDEQAADLDLIIRNIKKMGELTQKMTSITRYRTKQYVGDIQLVDIDQAIA